MNAVEIEEAVAALAAEPFQPAEFPFQFLAAFGFKETTLKKLKTGATNISDVPGGVLLKSHIHIAVAPPGETSATLSALKASPKGAKSKVKFLFATDGTEFEAEELATGEVTGLQKYTELANHFGFFLPLAGISTVAEIKDNPIDIKATGRLNKLYIELLKDNLDWATDAKRPALNQFMARLIFCFFAEDTGIFLPSLFTTCIKQMTDPQSENTHEVIAELFRAMDTHPDKRKEACFRPWADQFPYVNGGLFAGTTTVPRFSKIARSYLIRAGELDWAQINPDIFGSMIQAVADDDERGSLGMHYTSVPNILKVLDPLFLDDLREKLEDAADSKVKLLNLRKRISNIRVFDPACGSGNFLVIAYIKLREIEAEIIRRRKDDDKKSWIKLTNFYGIEIKSFPAEIARLALLIAEFQCNVRHIGQREACLDVLPLHETGKVVTGNALRLNWLEICPPPQPPTLIEYDLAGATGKLALDAEPAVETFICGNPPYLGSSWQTDDHKEDLKRVFEPVAGTWKSLDYVAGWFMKAAIYISNNNATSAFVSTNSICQGSQVATLWPHIFKLDENIIFAHTSFKWSNLATNKAAVIVVIVGLGKNSNQKRRIYQDVGNREIQTRQVPRINAYLVPGNETSITKRSHPLSELPTMDRGNGPVDDGQLILEPEKHATFNSDPLKKQEVVKPFVGSYELINGIQRYCIWLSDEHLPAALASPEISGRLDAVARFRKSSPKGATRAAASTPHRFAEKRQTSFLPPLIVPKVSSENREYLPVALMPGGTIVSDNAFAFYEAPIWVTALVASRLHLVWIATVCGKMKTDFRYSNTLGWNTFPVPKLSAEDKANLTRCAQDIFLAREAHFPATIAQLYSKDDEGRDLMPADLRAAHDRNEETLERIYIGRRFKNDTERLEKLFDMYTKMIKDEEAAKAKAPTKGRKSKSAPADEGDLA